MRFAVCILFAIALVGRCSSSDSDQREASQVVAKAAGQSLRSPDAKPFRLHVRVHAQRVVGTPTDGTYDEIWFSSDDWRREIAFPGLNQVEVGDADSKWMSRNLDFQPRLVLLLERAILVPPEIHQQESVTEIRNQKRNGVTVRCVRLKSQHWADSELCFDPSGALLTEESGVQRFEYSDYAKFGDKIFPREIHVYEKGKEVLALTADDPTVVTDPTPKPFGHAAAAIRLARCDRSSRELIKKVPPRYPEDARSSRIQGTVVLYVLLSGDGRVQKTKVLESAGESLDAAAIQSVQQWEYSPACGATPLPTETEVQINFALN